jgi:choline dehydrogenase-like flavoprotein
LKKLDANRVESGSVLGFDICVIGGGAAGITICKEFRNKNYKVCLLESGDLNFDEKTQSLYDFTSTGHPLRSQSGYISRNRYLGGSSNTWMGQCAPLDELDFTKREWVKNSGWPITKSELVPYYRKACDTLKIPSYENFESTEWFKFLLDKSKNFLNKGVVNPTLFLLGKRPINMKHAYFKELENSSNIHVITNANVTNIQNNEDQNEITFINVATLAGNSFSVKSRFYVLACGGLENARILLSSSEKNENGLANKYDVLGRYYMEHPKIMSGKLIPTSKIICSPVFMWKKKINAMGYLRTYLKLSSDVQKQERMLNHSVEITYPHSVRDSLSYSENFFSKLKFSKSFVHDLVKLAPHVFRLLESFEKLLLNLPVKFDHLLINNHMEQAPNKESRVTLGNEVDALGMRKLNLHLIISRKEKESITRFHEVLNTYLEKENIGKIESHFPEVEDDWPGLTDSSHHMGTTRMSEDPKLGYVDKNCKVHGISNLFVIGSSVFSTGGHVNPTLTIVALALRLASKLEQLSKNKTKNKDSIGKI